VVSGASIRLPNAAEHVRPVLEAVGMAEVEHNPKNNRMRAVANRK
jgi:hypothetical protein